MNECRRLTKLKLHNFVGVCAVHTAEYLRMILNISALKNSLKIPFLSELGGIVVTYKVNLKYKL